MNNNAKDYMLNQLALVATRVSLHNSSGVEITGGSYARQVITWGSASSGSISDSSIPAFSVPAGASISQVRLWNTAGSTEYANFAVTTETFANAGTYTVTDLTIDLNK